MSLSKARRLTPVSLVLVFLVISCTGAPAKPTPTRTPAIARPTSATSQLVRVITPVPTNTPPPPALPSTSTPTSTTIPTATPTHTPSPVPPTPTPTPPPLSIAIPQPGAIYAAFPWQIVITSTAPLTFSLWLEAVAAPAQPAMVTWGGRQVAFPPRLALGANQTMKPEGKHYLYRWGRTVNDLRELKDGEYRLLIEVIQDKGKRLKPKDTHRVEFTIDSKRAVEARVADADESIGVRLLPTAGSARIGPIVTYQESVRVLGQLYYVDEQGYTPIYNSYELPEQWCYFETQDGRRGWIWCKVFAPLDEVDQVPLLAPPISTRLYESGGR